MLKELRDGKLVEPSPEILESLQAAKSVRATTSGIVGEKPAYSATETQQIASVRVRVSQMMGEPTTKN